MFTGLKGNYRRAALKLHRLAEFDLAWDAYLSGRVSAVFVTYRAKKMLEVGLPRLK
jgi:hypothetical protein